MKAHPALFEGEGWEGRGRGEKGGAKILIIALLLLYELLTNLNILRIGKSVTRKVGERFISDRLPCE